MKTCTFNNCFARYKAQGLCAKHYRRLLQHGHATVTKVLRGSPQERFWAKVDKTPGFGPQGDCWRWTAAHFAGKEYGSFSAENRKTVQAHRYSWSLANGRQTDKIIRHSCDTPACVNPSHLLEGALQDNSDDMVARDRQKKGEQVKISKLTESQVQEIRQLLAQGVSANQVAKRYGVTSPCIDAIKHDRTWKHVPKLFEPPAPVQETMFMEAAA